MVWDATKPAGADAIQDSDQDIRANFAALEAALNDEHNFPTSGAHTAITATSLVVTGGDISASRDSGTILNQITQYTTDAVSGQLSLRKARGTKASPTVISASDNIAIIAFEGYDGSAFVDGAQIKAVTTELFSPTARGTLLDFFTVDNTTTTLGRRLRIDQNGDIVTYGGDIKRDVDNSLLTVQGGVTANGSSRVDFYGDTHASSPGAMNLYADTLIISPATSGGNTLLHVDSSGRWRIGGLTPDNSAILSMQNTSYGFLPPRMTTTQRNAISSPSSGLMIYNSSTNVLNFYNGSSWGAV